MKALKYLAAVVLATTMFSCGQNSKTGQTEADSLRSELELKQKEMDELLSTINFVQDGFDQIDQMEGRIDMAMGDAGTTSDRSRIESQMNFIITRMKENRDKIEQLNKMLRDSKNVSAQTKHDSCRRKKPHSSKCRKNSKPKTSKSPSSTARSRHCRHAWVTSKATTKTKTKSSTHRTR